MGNHLTISNVYNMFLILASISAALSLGTATATLSHRVSLKLKPGVSPSVAKGQVKTALESITSTEDFWKLSSGSESSVIEVPAFGWRIGLDSEPEGALTLALDRVSEEECGWLCVRLFRKDCLGSKALKDCVDISHLAKRVLEHYNSLAPDPGTDAQVYAAPEALAAVLTPEKLDELRRTGLVIVDDALGTFMAMQPAEAASANEEAAGESALSLRRGVRSLSERGLLALTSQGAHVREDSVGWFDGFESDGDDEGDLRETRALRSGLALLRGVAAHLNRDPRDHGEPFADLDEGQTEGTGFAAGAVAPPLAPGTLEAPLTVPSHVMVAQYPAGGHYCPHSDNGLEWITPAGVSSQVARRRNHRCFTAIVYANRPDWDAEKDGGCLRVYLGSGGGPGSACGAALLNPGNDGLDGAVAQWPRDKVVEVAPKGGRLVVFDSTLVHQVLPSKAEERRAMTMWIGRPISNQAKGETWDVGEF